MSSPLLSSLFPLPFGMEEEKEKQWKNKFTELIKPPNIIIGIELIYKLEYKNKNHQMHRNTYVGPARIYYYESGQLYGEEYLVKYKFHRPPEEGPAIVCYYKNGQIKYEEYYFKDRLHRLNSAANIWYYENGQIRREQYWVKGMLHRSLGEGPAVISYHEDGQMLSEEYWVKGERVFPY